MENITYAAKAGLEAIAITDHGTALGDAPHKFYYPSFFLFLSFKIFILRTVLL